MTKEEYAELIKKACEDAGTYRPFFSGMIDTLAEILQRRDDLYDEFERTGSQSLMEYTNRSGIKNYIKNPTLQLWNELSKTALTYWRELGLTPNYLNKIRSLDSTAVRKSVLTEALEKLEKAEEAD